MRNIYDHIAKRIGKGALDTAGTTVSQYEVSRDAQHADLWHEPDPEKHAERVRLGLLGDITKELCLIEVFGHSPAGRELRASLSKHFAYWEERLRRSRRSHGEQPPLPMSEPQLWMIAASFSAPMLAEIHARPSPEHPRGVYIHGGKVYRTGIIVASELPRDRSTLLVRLMAGGQVLGGALDDLMALPEDALEHSIAEEILVQAHHRLGRKQNLTSEEEEVNVKMLMGYREQKRIAREEGRLEGRQEGRLEGRQEGSAEATARAVLTALRVRSIPITNAVRERILAERDQTLLERWLERAIRAVSVADVVDAPS